MQPSTTMSTLLLHSNQERLDFSRLWFSDDEQHKHIFSGIMFLLFKENDLQFTKNEIKLNVKDEIIKPTWAVVNELNSHGGRMITCQDLAKMCKWDQWTTIQNLWRSWGIWMMPKACWDINAIGNLKGVNKQSLGSTDYLYICFIGFEGVYIQKLRK